VELLKLVDILLVNALGFLFGYRQVVVLFIFEHAHILACYVVLLTLMFSLVFLLLSLFHLEEGLSVIFKSLLLNLVRVDVKHVS